MLSVNALADEATEVAADAPAAEVYSLEGFSLADENSNLAFYSVNIRLMEIGTHNLKVAQFHIRRVWDNRSGQIQTAFIVVEV